MLHKIMKKLIGKNTVQNSKTMISTNIVTQRFKGYSCEFDMVLLNVDHLLLKSL